MCPRAGLCVRNSSLSHPPRDDDDYTPPRPCSSGDAEDQMGIVKYTRKQPTVFFSLLLILFTFYVFVV